MAKLFVLLLLAHVFGDFVLQNQAMSDGKFKDAKGIKLLCAWRSTHLREHAVIIFMLMTFVVIFPYCWLTVLAALAFMLAEYAFQNIKIHSVEPYGWFKKSVSFINNYHQRIQMLILAVVLIYMLLLHSKYLLVIMAITATHFAIDAIKSKVENMKINGDEIHDSGYELYTFSLDQLIHVLILYLCAFWLIAQGWKEPTFLNFLSLKSLVFFLMFFACGKPANILTRRILVYLKIDMRDKQQNDEKKTGRVIGLIERRLIIFFMFIQQFAAIGFLITAKSILRFSDINQSKGEQHNYITDKSEYVLIGTFVSISIAAACGFIIMFAGNPGILSVDKLIEAVSIYNIF